MDPKQISNLAKLLKDNGDKVLNADFKLSLSGVLLRALNDSFSLIVDQNELSTPKSFQVVKPNNSKSEVFQELQFLHDFVQKITILCISRLHNDEEFDGNVDITKFRNLKKLEINRIPIKQVIGIQQMRSQLHELICTRSISSIKDLICSCGGDNSNGFVWNALKVADLSYNTLTSIDCSLEFAPWLQILNLSHNQLTSVDAIKWLPNLKILNISFNCLTFIPIFNIEAFRRLQILILTNNFIEDISGVSRLDALNELNLSGNCLLDHSTLLPLSTLAALRYINLQGNPLSCHPKHRQATARYLHKNTSTVKFILDYEILSKFERTLTGNYQSYQSILTSRLSAANASNRSSGQRTPTKPGIDCSPSGSVSSTNSAVFNESKKEEENTLDDMSNSFVIRKKKLKVRRAVIAAHSDIIEEKKDISDIVKTSLEGNREHLETKKQIEDLRKKFGDGWLHSEGRHMVHDVLGIQQNVSNSEKLFEDLLQQTRIDEEKDDSILSSTPNNQTRNFPDNMESPIANTSNNTTFTEYKSVIENTTTEQLESLYKSTANDTTEDELADIYSGSYVEQVSDSEPNEDTYLVILEPTEEDIFVIVSDLSIKEKDALSAKTVTKWSIKSLESCERTKSDVIRINFDTVRKDKKERIYKMDLKSCQKLEQSLRDILSKRPLSEMNQTVFRCANCATQFSRENINKKQKLLCPECGSSFIIEIKESPKFDNERFMQQKQQQPTTSNAINNTPEKIINILPKSASQNSIGSAGSLNESSSCSKISNSLSSFDSNQSVAGSSNNERDSDFNMSSKGMESDIEILSNPSQSSIEVLDSKNSSRKHSEERKIIQIPSLDTIDDVGYNYSKTITNLHLIGTMDHKELINKEKHNANVKLDERKNPLNVLTLTESSSSGSVTDSICTAYEQVPTKIIKDKIDELTISDDQKIVKKLEEYGAGTQIQIKKPFSLSNDFLIETKIEKYQYKHTYKDLLSGDYRLKAYVYKNVIHDQSEMINWIIKARVYSENISKEYPTGFTCLLCYTTEMFRICRIIGDESDERTCWLSEHTIVQSRLLNKIRVLPWKIGVTFVFREIGNMHFILQDTQRTDDLLSSLTVMTIPVNCTIDYEISEQLSQKLLQLTDDDAQINMFAIFNSCEQTLDEKVEKYEYGSIIITETILILMDTNWKWLNNNNTDNTEILIKHQMNNLVDLETIDTNEFVLNFLDEQENKCELWRIKFETDDNANSIINAIGQSWEKIFGVPLGN